MDITKGFITLATGSEDYYRLAKNLLHSYRFFSDRPLPFAILADRENEYTAEFDDVLILKNGANNSYLDKLSLGEYLPYDINIFIDSDCLAFGDLNKIFDCFDNADDFSCFGRTLPLDDRTGWFEYENLDDLKSQVSYIVGLHGGIYYMRKGEMCNKIFQTAKSLVEDYYKFKFKGKFDTPGDEPLIALSMAVNGCHPVLFDREKICCYWEYVDCMSIDITEGRARVERDPKGDTILLHFGTRYTRELKYKQQIELLNMLETYSDDSAKCISKCKKHYNRLIAAERRKKFVIRVKNKIKRMLGVK